MSDGVRVGTWLSGLATVPLLAGCGGAPDPPPVETPAAAVEAAVVAEQPDRMRALLAEIRDRDVRENFFFGRGQIERLEGLLESRNYQGGERGRLMVTAELGRECLNYGEIERGIELLEGVYQRQLTMGAPDAVRAQAALDVGLAYFRLGETENCCAVNSPESCILPLRGKAIHRERRGSENALRYFVEAAERSGSNKKLYFEGVWFANLAAMTLGEYPDAVPELLRLPGRLFEGEGEAPAFVNVAAAAGVDRDSLAGGVLAEDFDNDGDLDLVVSSWDSSEMMRYYENRGADGGFVERSEAAGFGGILGGLNLVQADYDNDGDVDFLVLRGAWLRSKGQHPNSLMRNEGGGVFTDVTFEAGLGEKHWPTQTAGWADYDNDGDVDLYIGNETTEDFTAPSQLFRNEGDGTFVDVAEAAGVTNLRWAKGVVWGDFDGDRWPDLVVSNYDEENRLYRNLGDGRFEDLAMQAGVELPLKSFPAWTWDYNGDGKLDLFVSSYSGNVATYVASASGMRVGNLDVTGHYLGDGRGGFSNRAEAEGLAAPMTTMGCSVGDLDNDGWSDFYLGTGEPNIAVILPNQLFMNRGRGEGFVDATMASGLGHLQKGHAVTIADLDDDGDLDVFEQMGGARRVDHFRDALFENPGTPDTHWIKVRLEGRESNRSGIGARICVRVKDAEGRPRSIYRWVGGGPSFGGNPLRQHIGIGTAESVDLLEVYWPTSNQVDTFLGVAVDRSVVVTEGERELGEVVGEAWELGGKAE